MIGSLLTGADLGADVSADCDVCIVGSGAGGAVLAAGLAEAGLRVMMFEEGGAYTKRDFDLQERNAYRRMYQEQAGRGTADAAISILQGRSVGGSTTVNWTTCFRTPARILKIWEETHGLQGLDEASLAPHFEAVEARLNIHPWSEAPPNPNNQLVLDGARALGWEAAITRRNVKGCANSGMCGVGCPVDGKQAMHVTTIPDAIAAGMTLYADTWVERVELSGGRVVAVLGRVLDRATGRPTGRTVTVRPKVAVVSGGAINSPALLLRSGVNPNGRVGKRTFLHPVVAVIGSHDRPILGFFGAPQSAASHHYVDRGPDRVGFFIEAAPVQPMLAALSGAEFGLARQAKMAGLSSSSALIALAVDGVLRGDEGGTVSVRSDGRIKVDYPIRPALEEAFRAGHEALLQMEFAAGARAVLTSHVDGDCLFRSADEIPRVLTLPHGAHRHGIFTAHQMGGCAMGGDPANSVLDAQHRVRGVANLFVVDGSALPTSLGVNPSETIYGLAHRAVPLVAGAV